MTRMNFASTPYYDWSGARKRSVYRFVGTQILRDNNLVIDENLTQTQVTYNSTHVALAFLNRFVTPDTFTNITESMSGDQLVRHVLSTIEEYYLANPLDGFDFQEFKAFFTHCVAFGFTNEGSSQFFAHLNWTQRSHVHKIDVLFQRDEGLDEFVRENYKYIIIPNTENGILQHTAYTEDYFRKYPVADVGEVYSRIPSEIANSFSYCLQINTSSTYHNYSTHLLSDVAGSKALLAGPAADIVFEDYHKETYIEAMDSSEKIESYYLKTPFRNSISLQKSLVRKKTLKKGYSIIPVIDNVDFLDPVTLECTPKKFLRIRINGSNHSFIKYKSAYAFLKTLPNKFFSFEGLAWIDPDLYKQKLSSMLGNISKHNPAFVEKIIASGISVNEIVLPQLTLPSEAVTVDEFRYHEATSAAVEIPKLKNLVNIEQAYTSLLEKKTTWSAELDEITRESANHERACARIQNNISYYEEEVARCKKMMSDQLSDQANRDVKKVTLENNIAGIADTVSSLKTQVEEAKAVKHDAFMSAVNSIEVKWLDNVKRSNVEFISCYYSLPILWKFRNSQQHLVVPASTPRLGYDSREGEAWNLHINIKDCPQLAFYAQEKTPIPLELIFGENAKEVSESYTFTEESLIPQLSMVYFNTIKPSIITVDGSPNRQVVGGPYTVQLSAGLTWNDYDSINTFRLSPSLLIKLKDESSVFGYTDVENYNTCRFWIHPHTNNISFTFPNVGFLKTAVDCVGQACLGDASPSLYRAFQESNVRSAIFSAKTWIESANSSDTWGRNYKNFPKLEDIVLDDIAVEVTTISDSQEISEMEVNEMLQDLMDQAVGEEQPNQVAQPEVIVQTFTPTVNAEQRINELVREAMQDIVGETEPVIIESTPPDSPPPRAYTTYAEVVIGN